jgi:hypothetical protein
VFNLYADKAPGLYGSDPVNLETSVSYYIIFSDSFEVYINETVTITIASGTSSGVSLPYAAFDQSNIIIGASKNPGQTSPSLSSFGTQIYSDGGINDLCN